MGAFSAGRAVDSWVGEARPQDPKLQGRLWEQQAPLHHVWGPVRNAKARSSFQKDQNI